MLAFGLKVVQTWPNPISFVERISLSGLRYTDKQNYRHPGFCQQPPFVMDAHVYCDEKMRQKLIACKTLGLSVFRLIL